MKMIVNPYLKKKAPASKTVATSSSQNGVNEKGSQVVEKATMSVPNTYIKSASSQTKNITPHKPNDSAKSSKNPSIPRVTPVQKKNVLVNNSKPKVMSSAPMVKKQTISHPQAPKAMKPAMKKATTSRIPSSKAALKAEIARLKQMKAMKKLEKQRLKKQKEEEKRMKELGIQPSSMTKAPIDEKSQITVAKPAITSVGNKNIVQTPSKTTSINSGVRVPNVSAMEQKTHKVATNIPPIRTQQVYNSHPQYHQPIQMNASAAYSVQPQQYYAQMYQGNFHHATMPHPLQSIYAPANIQSTHQQVGNPVIPSPATSAPLPTQQLSLPRQYTTLQTPQSTINFHHKNGVPIHPLAISNSIGQQHHLQQQMTVQNRPVLASAVPKPTKPLSPSEMVLSKGTIVHPSPFAKTHELVNEKIRIWKRRDGSIDTSFGVHLTFVQKGCLVAVEDTKSKSNQEPKNDQLNTTPTKENEGTKSKVEVKPKRKRVKYGAMVVTNADAQQKRALPGTGRDQMIQKGDIILQVNSIQVSDKLFHDATKLFASGHREETLQDGRTVFICELVVAREKSVVTALNMQKWYQQQHLSMMSSLQNKPVKVPLVVNDTNDFVLSGEFTTEELKAFTSAIKDKIMSRTFKDSSFTGIMTMPEYRTVLQQRTEDDLKKKWVVHCKSVDRRLVNSALTQWRKDWVDEKKKALALYPTPPTVEDIFYTSDSLKEYQTHLTPSKRSDMRSSARPVNGCKCGSLQHNYVNDIGCFLYRDCKNLMEADKRKELEVDRRKKEKNETLKKYEGKLNSIGNAHVQRIVKQNDELKAEALEARFVDEMERIQISTFKVAVFAPSLLSVLILSTIAAIADMEGKEVYGPSLDESKAKKREVNSDERDSDSDSDDDDDIPLMALGKRSSPSKSSSNKKSKLSESQVDLAFMTKVANYISKVWGHVYKEPIDVEHAWIQHCLKKRHDKQVEGNSSFSKKQRKDDYAFEHIQYLLNDTSIDLVSKSEPTQVATALHIIEKTALLEEVDALVEADLIEMGGEGTLKLKRGWERKVPPTFLYDMQDQGWNKISDVSNKFCLHEEIRNKLDSQWKNNGYGWLHRSDSDSNILISHEKYYQQKDSFTIRFTDHLNEMEGVAQFGI